jgi:predicted nucleotidyltransferase
MATHDGLNELTEKMSLVRERLAPEHIIVFGSVARGEATSESDLDVIFVSERFAGVKEPDRPELIFDIIWRDISVDTLCYTPEEFRQYRTQPGIIKTACEEGIWL